MCPFCFGDRVIYMLAYNINDFSKFYECEIKGADDRRAKKFGIFGYLGCWNLPQDPNIPIFLFGTSAP